LGKALSTAEFADLCLALEARGAANVNIVTGTHASPAIAAALREARRRGLSVPILWNTSGYESAAGLAPLRGLVNIYLPDLKTLDAALARRYFAAPDYGDAATRAILWMMEQAPLKWKAAPFESELLGGVIVRHLVMPGELRSTQAVLEWFARNARGRALLSLMTQYTPVVTTADTTTAPSRHVNKAEYDELIGYLCDLSLDDGYVQELVPDDEWLPDFEKENPFGAELSVPVWSRKKLYTRK
jgi:putative pyruvate formate lyase activating enzyme